MAEKRAASSSLGGHDDKRRRPSADTSTLEQQQATIRNQVFHAVDTMGKCSAMYEMSTKLGKGSYGRVYLGRMKGSGEEVAIKVQQITAYNPSIVSELLLLKSFEHGNITRYIDSFLDGNTLSIVMECVSGVTAEKLAARSKLTSNAIASVCRGVLQALEYLHEGNIIHRDIKGENVLLGEEGAVKVTDFGLSTIQGYVRQTGLGTPPFMAPEAFNTTDFTVSVDIWSLGMTVVELNNGRRPYANTRSFNAIKDMILGNQMPKIKNKAHLPTAMIAFIKLCQRMDASERGTATELLTHEFLFSADSCERLGEAVRRLLM